MSLKDILYYTKAISAPIYSDTPGTYISPERLIEGLPPFLSFDNSSQLLPKTLIIPQQDLSTISWRTRAALVYRLKKLKQAGHAIKQMAGNLLIDVDVIHTVFQNLEPVPSLKICSSLLNTSADELLICDENIIQLLINGDASDLEEFKPFKHIILRDHPLTQELFEQLLCEHEKTIETIEVVNCPNITDLQRDKLSNLLSLNVGPFVEEPTPISNIRETILKNASRLETLVLDMYCFDKKIINDICSLANLKTLNLSFCDIREDMLDNISFIGLELLRLNRSTIDIVSLQALLQRWNKLKRLELSDCSIANNDTLNGISLRELEELNLYKSTINMTSIQALLQGAPNLKILNLSSCSSLSEIIFNDLLLSELEELDLKESTINSASLQALLQGTFKLKILDLSNCENLTDDILKPISLGELEYLDLRYSAISLISLQALLQNSPKLKYLVLSNCRTLGEYTFHDILLSELEELDIYNSTINSASLQTLLQEAPKLKILKLSRYTKFSEYTFNNISLRELEKLSLKSSVINIASLQTLLQGTLALKTLNLSRCKNLQEGMLNGISLGELAKLNLSCSTINTASLQELLQGAPKIKTLDLSYCKNLHEGMLYGISLGGLVKLNLSRSTINTASLQELLQGAPKIKTLDLSYCKNLDEDVLSSILFGELENLILNDSTVRLVSLQALLQGAPKIKSIDLSGCQLLGKLTLNGILLGELEKLDLESCTIDAASLHALLQSAPKVTTLNLSYCKNISDSDYEAFVKQYTSIKFIKDENHFSNKKIVNISQFAASQDQQKQIQTLDANTDVDKKTHIVEREFIAEPLPDTRMMRHECYQRIALNPDMTGSEDVFLLINEEPFPLQGEVLKPTQSAVSLIKAFCKDTKNQSFARPELTLTDQWQKLPSNSSNETIKSYYSASGVAVEFLKSPHGFHYVRAMHPEDAGIHKLELLFDNPKPLYTFNDLPEAVKEIAAFCRGFREESLDSNAYTNAADFLSALLTERCGSCRHRAGVFQQLMQEHYPAIATQIMRSRWHAFVEVYHQGTWVPIDLGGYAANLEVKDTLLPEASTLSLAEEDPFANLAVRYQQTFSDRGRPRPPDFFERAKNLTLLKLEHMQKLLVLEQEQPLLDTLQITSCQVTANALHSLLQHTPNLKTLALNHCTITPEEFAKLDLSSLPLLEHVTLNGSFIPSHEALNHFISTAQTKPKWVINCDHLDALPQDIFSNNSVPELNPNDTAKVAFKHTNRKLPARYFPVKGSGLDVIASPFKKILIDTEDPEALRLGLQAQCMKAKEPCFFAPDADTLRCAGRFIAREGNKGIVAKGPGGALYDFIQAHKDVPFTLLVDYSQFKPADIAAFNSLLDDERTIEGIPLPKNCKIVGLVNRKDPNCYDGADFFSRFDCCESEKNCSVPMAVEEAVEANPAAERRRVIELCGSPDWEARLVGSWQIDGQQLGFKEGELVRALREGVNAFSFNNPPQNDKAFQRFLHDLSLHQAIYYRGHKEIDLPSGFSYELTNEASFAKYATRFTFSEARLDSALLLNSATLADFLGKYHEENFGLILKPGLIEAHQGQTLALYLTQTLADTDWLKFLECARRHLVHLQVTLAPGVTMPSELMPNKIQPLTLEPRHHTQCIKGQALYPEDAIVIDVSELEPQDLLPAFQNHYDEERAAFRFTETKGFLLEALAANKTVVLTGRFQERFAQALQALLYTRLTADSVSGNLWLSPDKTDIFSLMPVSVGQDVPLAPAISLSVSYEERYDAVFSVLEKHPFVLLTGETGVGKTHFVTHDWQVKHPNCHYGDDKILEWLNDKRLGLKTLFIDEANLTHKEWSLFEGLFNTPPAIFYQGQYYPLSPEHKVIFAGNPTTYGGERQLPSLFKKHPCAIEFNPLPREVLVNLLDLQDEKATAAILDVIEGASYITPREIIMMATLTKAAFKNHPETHLADWASYFAYRLAKPHAPTGKLRGTPSPNPTPCSGNIGKLVINKSNRETVHALRDHLSLRALRLNEDNTIPQTGGLGGIILEGEPGIGKSLAVTECLHAFGVAEEDVCRIPVSLNSKLKEARLIEAFHEGKVVIIDEINSSPMLERVLNALLEGHDLDGKPANKPGFMIIGTQNPTTFRGRTKTTLPLKHRLETIIMPDYTDEDILHTLRTMALPNRVAMDMLDEFKSNRLKNTDLCVRDLLKAADKWLLNQKSVAISLEPIPQVGSLCKVAAVANVVQHRATQEGIKFTPLRKNKTHSHSIRKLAKELGSVQGELLEFAQWQALAEKGFHAHVVDFKEDFNHFFDTILDALTKGHLPLIAFALNQDTGLPDPNPHNPNTQEHAAVISGYNAKTDEFTLAHWGHIYHVDAVSLFNANQVLATTRLPEYYKLNPDFRPDDKAYIPKYVPHQSPSVRNSIIPHEGTGFNGKLLVIQDKIKTPNAFFSKKRERDMNETNLEESVSLIQLSAG